MTKLFEFMHEHHPGVQVGATALVRPLHWGGGGESSARVRRAQDMACDTFLKISQKCRRMFAAVQVCARVLHPLRGR